MKNALKCMVGTALVGVLMLPMACSQSGSPSGPVSADLVKRKFPTKTPTRTATFTPTPTRTPTIGSPTPTRTATLCPACVTFTPTFTPTPGGPAVCPPTPIAIAAGKAIMNYGQARAYVIRDQGDWDVYRGTTGSVPPVDFVSQMVLAVNWGTEFCQPTNGRVVNYTITSVCASPNAVNATAVRGSTCPPCSPPSCVYTMGSNQVVAAVLPASGLTVSVSGVADVVQNLP